MSKRHYTVKQLSAISPTTLSLKLERGSRQPQFSFQAGQYAAISYFQRGRPTPTRCFSIVSSPIDTDHLEFGIRVKGPFTRGLTRLRPGDRVVVDGPFGAFVLDQLQDRRIVMLAGGIGITPLLSQIRYALRATMATNIVLVYSCPTQSDVPYAAELLRLARQHTNFQVLFAISRGGIDALPYGTAVKGRITPDVLGQLPLMTSNEWQKNTYFICGPASFMAAMTSLLRAKEVSEDRIISEAFTQSATNNTQLAFGLPRQVYVLATVGVLVGSAIVMTADIAKKLPKAIAVVNSSQALPTMQTSPVISVPSLPAEAPISSSTPDSTSPVTVAPPVTTKKASTASKHTASVPATAASTPPPAAPTPSAVAPTPAPTPKPVTIVTPPPAPAPTYHPPVSRTS